MSLEDLVCGVLGEYGENLPGRMFSVRTEVKEL